MQKPQNGVHFLFWSFCVTKQIFGETEESADIKYKLPHSIPEEITRDAAAGLNVAKNQSRTVITSRGQNP